MSYYLNGKCSEITQLVSRYRFINRIQIQQFLHHKGPRRINSWLKQLTEWEFIGRIYSNKLLENTKPAIYYLSYKGISYIKEKNKLTVAEVKKFYEDKNRSQVFINHCIDVCFLLSSITNYDDEERTYQIFPKEQLIKNHFLSELKPDGYIELFKKKTKTSKEKVINKRFILNLIDSGVPRYAIRFRINQYINFHQEDTWKEYASEFPYIIFIFPTIQKQNQFAKYIKTQLDEGLFTQGMTFLLTTYEKAMKEGLIDGIWMEIREE